MALQFPEAFLTKVYKIKDDLLNFVNDYEYLQYFFSRDQEKILFSVLNALSCYGILKNFIENSAIDKMIISQHCIINRFIRYGSIPQKPEYTNSLIINYQNLITRNIQPAAYAISAAMSLLSLEESSRFVEMQEK